MQLSTPVRIGQYMAGVITDYLQEFISMAKAEHRNMVINKQLCLTVLQLCETLHFFQPDMSWSY